MRTSRPGKMGQMDEVVGDLGSTICAGTHSMPNLAMPWIWVLLT